MIETPALTVALVTKLLGKAAGIEVRAALAVFVDEPLIGKQRPILGIQRRQLAIGDVVGDRSKEVVGIGRAARDIDDGGADIAERLFKTDSAGRVATAGGHPAPGGTGADGNDGSRIGSRAANMVDDGLTGHHAVDAAIFERNGTIHYQHILALVAGHGVVLVLFSLVAKCCREHLMVFEGDSIEDQVLDGGVRGPQQRLGAACALLCPYPDHRRPLGAGERSGHLGDGILT